MDAALIALHRSQHLTATLNGVPVVAGQLDQNKIPKTEFRVEKITLSVGDRLAIRKLYQALELNCKSGEESAKAAEFLRTLLALANARGRRRAVAGPSRDRRDRRYSEFGGQ